MGSDAIQFLEGESGCVVSWHDMSNAVKHLARFGLLNYATLGDLVVNFRKPYARDREFFQRKGKTPFAPHLSLFQVDEEVDLATHPLLCDYIITQIINGAWVVDCDRLLRFRKPFLLISENEKIQWALKKYGLENNFTVTYFKDGLTSMLNWVTKKDISWFKQFRHVFVTNGRKELEKESVWIRGVFIQVYTKECFAHKLLKHRICVLK